MNWKGVIPAIAEFAVKRSPQLLMVAGTVGFVTTVCMTAKAAPKAKKVIEEHREKDPDYEVKAHILEEAKLLLPYYGPVLAMGAVSVGCFYGSGHIYGRRNAVLAAAASISEQALVTYQDKVIEKLGAEEHGKILEGIADDIRKEKGDEPARLDANASVEGAGDTLCYDRVTGRYFRSTVEAIRRAENVIVKRVVDDMTVPLNDFYEELGLEDVSVIGEAIGWDISKVKPDIRFSSRLDPEGVLPVLVLNYHTCLIRKSALEGMY